MVLIMINNIIKKSNINIYSMLKHGTVAVITLVGISLLFGVKNIMLAFPIALTSAVLGRQNLQIKTTNKIVKIIFIDFGIILAAFISSLNIYIGIIVNFITIFLIMYNMFTPYDLTFYKPFLMLYVFTQYAQVSIQELPQRLLGVIFGISVIASFNIIAKINEKTKLGETINLSLIIIKNQLNNINDNCYSEELTKQCTKIMRKLVYKIYITRHKKYLTTKLGKIQFNVYIDIEYFNLFLRNICFDYKNYIIEKNDILNLINIIDCILEYSIYKISIEELELKVYQLENKNSKEKKSLIKAFNIIKSLIYNLKELKKLNSKDINKVYEQWRKEDIESFKESFHRGMRFNFAMRMAITLSIVMFVGEKLGYHKVIWAIITIMSVIQPYYEYTINKSRERIIGNILGIVFTGIFINLINKKSITILILIISLYLLYAFKEYSKISFFASIASICISSLYERINVLLMYRMIYVLIGIIIVIVVNKIIFPYKLKDGISELINKIDNLNNKLVNYSIEILNGTESPNKIRDVIINSILLCEKLEIRNMNINDKYIDRISNINNEFVIQIGYRVLR